MNTRLTRPEIRLLAAVMLLLAGGCALFTPKLYPIKYLDDAAYSGTLQTGLRTLPVITRFRVNTGRIEGSYEFKERDDIVEGTIKDCTVEGAYTIVCSWEDKYGSGGLRIVFARGASSFSGFWGEAKDETFFPWNGIATRNPEFQE